MICVQAHYEEEIAKRPQPDLEACPWQRVVDEMVTTPEEPESGSSTSQMQAWCSIASGDLCQQFSNQHASHFQPWLQAEPCTVHTAPWFGASCAALDTQPVCSASLVPHVQPDLQPCQHSFMSNVSSSHVHGHVDCTALASLLASAISGPALLPLIATWEHLHSGTHTAPHVCSHQVPGTRVPVACSAQPDRRNRLPSPDLATQHIVDMLLQAQLQQAERAFAVYMAVREARSEATVKEDGARSSCKQLFKHQWDLDEMLEVSQC